ncbi:MAG: hypothetical protein HY079_08400 [Elusimicrobia bacterium]|nr:hypothetical protein [Elusimicrobiota bacterium]
MTPKAALWLALGSLLALPAPARALSADDAFAGSVAAVAAQAAASAAKLKADAAEAAAKAHAAAVPELLARARPDFSFTPGNLCTPSDPNFKEYRYPEHIPYCQRNVTRGMKTQVAAHYGVAEADWRDYEFDHLIPLAIGGDSSVDNLWPQPDQDNQGSAGKDRLENDLYLQMKAGTITQAEAVKRIYGWFDAAMLADKVLKVAGR